MTVHARTQWVCTCVSGLIWAWKERLKEGCYPGKKHRKGELGAGGGERADTRESPDCEDSWGACLLPTLPACHTVGPAFLPGVPMYLAPWESINVCKICQFGISSLTARTDKEWPGLGWLHYSNQSKFLKSTNDSCSAKWFLCYFTPKLSSIRIEWYPPGGSAAHTVLSPR